MLEHGGRLQRAVGEYGVPAAQWLDLSTGISPFGWKVPALPPSVWQRLPEDEDGLLEAAQLYYGAPSLCPVAGSQAAIQALPWLRPASRVGIVAPGYAEHAHAWQRAGHAVTLASPDALIERIEHFDVLVLIHPNNPTGTRYAPAQLLQLHEQLAARGGWLVVDEAFMDVTPQDTLCAYTDREGLIVLRSIGKFFGLAGARAGFVCATPPLLQALREQLGPWALSGPTRYVTKLALADRHWHLSARMRLVTASKLLAGLLGRHGLMPTGGCALFHWCKLDDAERVHRELAQRGILLRLFNEPAGIRLGLLPDEAAFKRLDQALHEVLR